MRRTVVWSLTTGCAAEMGREVEEWVELEVDVGVVLCEVVVMVLFVCARRGEGGGRREVLWEEVVVRGGGLQETFLHRGTTPEVAPWVCFFQCFVDSKGVYRSENVRHK